MEDFLSITDGKKYVHVNRPDAFALHTYIMNFSSDQEWQKIIRILYLHAHRLLADTLFVVQTEQFQQIEDFYNTVQQLKQK
jgi:hypothetical protein